MTIMYVLVQVCVWVVGFYKLEAPEAPMGFLKLRSLVCD